MTLHSREDIGTCNMSSTFATCFVYALSCYCFARTCTIKSPPRGAGMKLPRSNVFLQGLAGAHRPLWHHVFQPPKSLWEAPPSQGVPSRFKCFSPTALVLPLCDALNILKKPLGDALYFRATLLKTMQFAVVPVSFNGCAKAGHVLAAK